MAASVTATYIGPDSPGRAWVKSRGIDATGIANASFCGSAAGPPSASNGAMASESATGHSRDFQDTCTTGMIVRPGDAAFQIRLEVPVNWLCHWQDAFYFKLYNCQCLPEAASADWPFNLKFSQPTSPTASGRLRLGLRVGAWV